MRILGIVSSPRKGGNSELAVKEIMRHFPDDAEKVMIDLCSLDIKNCDACYACVPYGSKCVIQDDLDFIIRNVKHSDKVIVAAPAYMLGGHTMIKRVLDRLISLVADYPKFNYTDCVIVVPYGYDGWEGLAYEELLMFCKKLHLNVIGSEVMLATLPGDSVKGENLKKLQNLADILVNGNSDGIQRITRGNVADKDVLVCPFCGSSVMHIFYGGTARCGLCAAEMQLIHKDNGYDLSYDSAANHLFTHKSLDGHIEYLKEKKQLFLETRGDIKKLQEEYEQPVLWFNPEDLK